MAELSSITTSYCDQIQSIPWYFHPVHERDDLFGEDPPVSYMWIPAKDYHGHPDLMIKRKEFHDANVLHCRNCNPPPPKPPKDQSEYHRYFLTIQWNRKVTEAVWRDACDLFLQSKLFKHGVYAYETGSKGTNPHCHLFAFCQSKLCHNAKKIGHPIDQYKGTPHLKKFEYTYGHIDFQVVPKDNGIEKYISKESKKEYFSNTTDSVHPLQPCPTSAPTVSEPPTASDSASEESDQ